MIRALFIKLLRVSGKQYTPAPELPTGLLINTLITRFVYLLRGFCLFQKFVFVGSSSKIRGKSTLKLGRGVTIDHHCDLDGYAREGIEIGNSSKIGAYTVVSCTSHFSKLGKGFKMGSFSGIGEFSYIGSAGGVTIGDNVIMGQYISFHSENHNFEDTSKLIRDQGVTSQGILLGNDIWVGAKVTFLDGCQIGNHCVVAAGAVVKGTFPDNCVIGGVPAKILKQL
ncbi:MAG: acyltransferase [Bacteroidia bacterium]|nr:acyltransferase [Bacteroidia bacterium]